MAGGYYRYVLDAEQLIAELVKLREKTFESSRAFAEATNEQMSREIARKIENRAHMPGLDEMFVWLNTCGVNPGTWLCQFLSEHEQAVVERDRDLLKQVRHGIRDHSRREIIEVTVRGWAAQDEKLRRANLANRIRKRQSSK